MRKPDPMIVESLYRITARERTPWDAETLLILAIARENMQHRAMDKECEKPFSMFVTTEEAEERNETVTSTFFSRFRNK